MSSLPSRILILLLMLIPTLRIPGQRLLIANDLPALSVTETVSVCSQTRFLSGTLKWSHPYINDRHPTWMRAKIEIKGSHPGSEWRLDVSDGNQVLVRSFDSTQVTDSLGTVWTPIINDSMMTLSVYSKDDIDGFQFCIASVNTPNPATTVGIKSIVGHRDDRKDLVEQFGTNSKYHEFGRSVALIRFQDFLNGNGVESNCTGVLISERLVATNNHCIPDKRTLDTATVTFGYETNSTTVLERPALALVATSESLDYSILSIDAPNVPVATITTDRLSPHQRLVLIQHPDARLKRIAYFTAATRTVKAKCVVQEVRAEGRNTDFYHLCDSSSGSSGSPLMDASSGKVYGLHHLGESDPKARDFHNLGVYFREILDDLLVQHLTEVHDEIARESHL